MISRQPEPPPRRPSVRDRDARALPLLPVRQRVAHDEVRDVLARHAVPVPKVPVLERPVRPLALPRARVALARPVGQQRRADDDELLDLPRPRQPRGVAPAVGQHLLLHLVGHRPGQAAEVREEALRPKLVFVRALEHRAVERLERERERLVRGGGDAHGGDDDEARLVLGRAERVGDRAEGVHEGARDDVGRVEDEAAGHAECWPSAC